jgi:hypothetical protein
VVVIAPQLRLRAWLYCRRPHVVTLEGGGTLTLRAWRYDDYMRRYPLLMSATASFPHAVEVLTSCTSREAVESLTPEDLWTCAVEAVKFIGDPSVIGRFKTAAGMFERE